MKNTDFAKAFFDALPKNYESEPRLHNGELKHHKHRFPIKNGINAIDAACYNEMLKMSYFFDCKDKKD